MKTEELGASLEFEIALKMHNFSELQGRISHGERISSAEMADKYNPTSADYAKVVAWLSQQGFEVTRQDKNHLAIFASGKIGQIQNAMKMSFARVAMEGKEYTSGISAPNMPTELASLVVGINGLQPHLQMHKHVVMRPTSLTGSNPPFLPVQIAQAYNATGLYNSNVSGAGQSIAIVIDTFPATSDLQSFWTTYHVGQSLSNISFIQVVSGQLPSPSGEETLDTEWSSSIAPSAKVRVYAAQSLSFSALDQAYQQVYDDVIAHPEYGIHQMSMSYGIGEKDISNSQVQTDDQYFAELASAGVSIFVASGDSGSTPGRNGAGDESGQLQAESPATDPHVTSVGGTSLTLNAIGNTSSETIWNNGYGASGGGLSQYFTRPTWQTGPGVGSTSSRMVPDVSCAADPLTGAVVILQGGQYVFGGTSWSSPTWAGFCALINQNRANASLAPIGLLGPAIYPLIGTGNFRDITLGNNGTYGATAGYDMASGIGVPNVQALAAALLTSDGAPILTNGPPPANAAVNIPYSFAYTVVGRPAPTFSIASGNLPPGLALSSSGVISGTPTQAGSFSGTVSASNGVGTAATQVFTINVQPTATPPTFTDGPPPPTASVGVFYNFAYTASGTPDSTFALSSGSLPPGLTLSSLGVLSGTPDQTGVFTGTVVASNGVSPNSAQDFSITVQQAPSFTNGPPPSSAAINIPYHFIYTASGTPDPIFSVTSGNLPQGLSLSSAGVISGTPTQLGNFSGTVTASNGTSPSASQPFTIGIVSPGAPVITSPVLSVSLNVNSALTFTYAASGSPAPAFSLSSGALPPGVTLSAAGVLSGTPTQIGTYTGTVTASNGVNPDAIQNFSIVVLGNIVQQYSVFHCFPGPVYLPNSTMVVGANGNLYGTCDAGGVFQMTPQGVMAGFGGMPSQGLMLSSDGNFYGVSSYGGTHSLGAVFKMSPQGETAVLHNFGDGPVPNDGANPAGKLLEGADGSFYGVTTSGGDGGAGIVYRITKQGVMTVIHAFANGMANDGGFPEAGLILGPDGDFYGTTGAGGIVPTQQSGGASGAFFGAGTIYKITPQGAVTILHLFQFDTVNNDGAGSQSSLVLGSDGNFYGVTMGGGVANQGVVFKMAPDGTYTTLHRFRDGTVPNDGAAPIGTLMQGTDGNFYGTTLYGGAYGNAAFPGATTAGTVFQITPTGAYRILHSFPDPTVGNDGNDVLAGLVQAPDGSLYGTTYYGGGGLGGGIAFKLTLVPTPTIIAAPPPAAASAGVAYNFAFQTSGISLSAATYAVTAGALPLGLTLTSSGVLSGTPIENGTYTGTITATNGNTKSTQSFSITVSSNLNFGLWAGQHFTTAELADPTISDPASLPMEDGVSNLEKYLCGIDPTVPMAPTDRTNLPVLGKDTTANPGTEYLTFTYHRAMSAPDVDVTLETSDDLQTWTTVPSSDLLSRRFGTDANQNPIMEIGVKVDGSPTQFVRLKVHL